MTIERDTCACGEKMIGLGESGRDFVCQNPDCPFRGIQQRKFFDPARAEDGKFIQ